MTSAAMTCEYEVPLTISELQKTLFSGMRRAVFGKLLFIRMSNEEFWVRPTFRFHPVYVVGRIRSSQTGAKIHVSMNRDVTCVLVFCVLSNVLMLLTFVCHVLHDGLVPSAFVLMAFWLFWLLVSWTGFWFHFADLEKTMAGVDGVLRSALGARRSDEGS